jgi:hypothetical protein
VGAAARGGCGAAAAAAERIVHKGAALFLFWCGGARNCHPPSLTRPTRLAACGLWGMRAVGETHEAHGTCMRPHAALCSRLGMTDKRGRGAARRSARARPQIYRRGLRGARQGKKRGAAPLGRWHRRHDGNSPQVLDAATTSALERNTRATGRLRRGRAAGRAGTGGPAHGARRWD